MSEGPLLAQSKDYETPPTSSSANLFCGTHLDRDRSADIRQISRSICHRGGTPLGPIGRVKRWIARTRVHDWPYLLFDAMAHTAEQVQMHLE